MEYEVSIITQSEVGEDNYWRGFQPGYEKSGQYLSSDYVKRASQLIDTFDQIQYQHRANKFEEYHQILETGRVNRNSQKCSLLHSGRRKQQEQEQKKSMQQSQQHFECFNSDEKMKNSFFNEDKNPSERRQSLCKYRPQSSYDNRLHSSSHSHLSSSHKQLSNQSYYSNSVIRYGI